MGDFIQVLICCGCMVKPGQKKQPVLEERKDCMEKNVGSVYVQCINIFFLKLNWTTLKLTINWNGYCMEKIVKAFFMDGEMTVKLIF